MSFSSNVKEELCRVKLTRKCCAEAEAFGVLLYCNTFSSRQVKVITESRDFAERLPKLFRKAFGIEFDQLPQPDEQGKRSFVIADAEKIARIFHTYGYTPESNLALHVNFGALEEECCRISFLRGAYLAGGSVTDPKKRYHLELATTHVKVGAETLALILDLGFAPKITERGGNRVLYFKQSDYIEDFLTFLGAPVSAMAVMEAKVEKDLRNGVNRRVNCETANLTKVVDAAQEQLQAIRLLEKRGLLETLPEKLQATARLRQENPEATLLELAELSEPPLTKSAINHRMRKLVERAREEI